jgi:hypothetical protein
LDLLSFTEKCVVEIETQASTIGSLSQQIWTLTDQLTFKNQTSVQTIEYF